MTISYQIKERQFFVDVVSVSAYPLSEGKNIKGRLLGVVLGTIGRRVLERAFENSIRAIEVRNGAAREGAASAHLI